MRPTRAVATAAVGALAAGTASAAYQRAAELRDQRRFPPPGDLVDVGGRRLHVLRSGPGSPAMVVLPAVGTPAVEWARVARALAEHTDAAVVAVDRGGIGWSDPAPWPRTLDALCDELDALLTALAPSTPIVLVGHSVGGLVARLFAARYPHRLARLVLVDSSHEDQFHRLRAYEPSFGARTLVVDALVRRARWLGWRRLLYDLGRRPSLWQDALRESPENLAAAHLSRELSSRDRRAVVQEFLGVAGGRRPLRIEARDLGALPTTVITAGPAGRDHWWPGWLQLQRELAAMSRDSTHILLEHSGHHPNHDVPHELADILADTLRATYGHADR